MRQNASNRTSRSPSLSSQDFMIFSPAKDFTSNSLPSNTLHSALQIYQILSLLFISNIRVNRIIVLQCIWFVRCSVRVKRSKRRSEGAPKEKLCAFDANGQRILSMRPIGSHRNLTRCVARRGKTKRAGRMESQQDINIQDSCPLDKTADSSRASTESHGID